MMGNWDFTWLKMIWKHDLVGKLDVKDDSKHETSVKLGFNSET